MGYIWGFYALENILHYNISAYKLEVSVVSGD